VVLQGLTLSRTVKQKEPKERSRYCDWLRAAGRQRSLNSSLGRVKNFLFSTSSRPALGSTHPPSQWIPGVLSPEIKRSGREADHPPPTSAEVKKMWLYTSTPHTSSWRSAELVKHRENFTFYLTVRQI
jgi:hypothetical protein